MNQVPPAARLCEGILPALWTPTDADGRLLESELKDNLRFLVANQVHGLMALGSTGEFVQLEPTTRMRVLEVAVANEGGLPVLANISDVRPRIVAELGRFARRCGAAAVSVLPPYYFPVAQVDLVEFFVRAGEAAQLPLFLYNFPERVGNRITLETIAAVADRVPVAGFKQSGAEFDYHRALVQLGREKNFAVFTGADTALPAAMALGCAGCVSGLANAVPDLMVEVFAAVRTGQLTDTFPAANRMKELGTLADQLEFPLNIAAIMEARGLPTGKPKSIVSPATEARYERLVRECQGRFREWKVI